MVQARSSRLWAWVAWGAVWVVPVMASAQGAPVLSVEGGSGSPGGTAPVAIRLANDPEGTAASADLDIGFPTALLEFETPVSQHCVIAARLAATHQVGGTVPRPGNLLRFALFPQPPRVLPLGDGDLATCDFRILPDAGEPEAELTIVYAALGDRIGRGLAVTADASAIQIVLPTPTATPDATATPSPPPCPVDCNGNGAVTIDELVRSINIALGNLSASECPAADRDGNRSVSVAELVSGVAAALGGCPGR